VCAPAAGCRAGTHTGCAAPARTLGRGPSPPAAPPAPHEGPSFPLRPLWRQEQCLRICLQHPSMIVHSAQHQEDLRTDAHDCLHSPGLQSASQGLTIATSGTGHSANINELQRRLLQLAFSSRGDLRAGDAPQAASQDELVQLAAAAEQPPHILLHPPHRRLRVLQRFCKHGPLINWAVAWLGRKTTPERVTFVG